MNHVRILAAGLLCGGGYMATTGMAFAQDVARNALAGDAPSGLADIVVTAQRQSQSIQKVPISVSAISSDSLESRQITDTIQIAAAVPNLTMTQSGYVATPFLRGVGSNQSGPADEPSVATYIDGVYIPSPAGNIFRLNNIERIEVLKGPQGTLFGRNATGGVIQIITKDPSHDPEARGSISYGSFETLEGSAYLSTGLGKDLAIDVSSVFSENNKGFGFDINRKAETMKRNNLSVRSKLLWTPGETTEVRIAGGYTRVRSSGTDFQPVFGVKPILGVPSTLPPRTTNTDFANSNNSDTYDLSLNIRQDLGFARLVSITGYRDVDGLATLDQDSTPIPAVRADINYRAKSWSQELQLLSPLGSKINWLVGLYAFEGKFGYDPLNVRGIATFNSQTRTRSLAGFGQVTVPLGDTTNFTAGLRYTHERQRLLFGLNAFPVVEKNQGIERLTWRASIDHQFTPDVMGYVSYNRGIKSGGFGLTNAKGYRPEVLDAYEVGFKSQMFDNRIRLNAAVFYYNYKDIQVSFIANGAISTENAARARIYGFDADLTFKMSDNLTLNAGFGYTNAKYKDFPSAPFFPLDAGPATQGDASGNTLTGAPPVTANASLNYSVPTEFGKIGANFTVSYRGKVFSGPDNRLALPEYTLANATVSWKSRDERFSVSLWARNLFNKEYVVNRTEQANLGAIQAWGDPRVLGATVGVGF